MFGEKTGSISRDGRGDPFPLIGVTVLMTSRFVISSILVLFLLIPEAPTHAQVRADWKGRPRYPDGMLALRGGYGFTKYLGEFVDHTVDRVWTVSADYSFMPEFGFGVTAEFGNLHYLRRSTRLSSREVYEYQFGPENEVDRLTWFSTYDLHLLVNFFPRQYFNIYALAGAGVLLYGPEDYEHEATHVPSRNPHLATAAIPLGLGVEWFFARHWSLTAELRHRLVFQDDLDAYPTEKVRRAMYLERNLPLEELTDKEADDSFTTLTLGVRWYLFEDEDLDSDGLRNQDEEAVGTNPHDPDSDRDRLDDFEEVTVLGTNPLLEDSDADGLHDYDEVHTYLSSPLKADTDQDSIPDGKEVLLLRSNPLRADTDADSLMDGEELALGTDLLSADTDKDHLTDFEEVTRWHTDPRNPDSDSDELTDGDEAMHEHTDPLRPDTDGDELSDGEEVLRERTDPLRPDTDGDGLNDGEEVRRTGTDPRSRDTDSDGFSDAVDRCPRIAAPATSAGCPEDSKGGVTRLVLPPMSRVDTVLQIDTVVIREGGTLTLFGVNFEVDKAIIRPESLPILEINAQLFTRYPDLVVEIRGHTDSDGSAAHNRDLSDRRARAVRATLIRLGVPADRMTARGYGEDMPVASNATPEGKARNRRIEFFIPRKEP